MSALKSRILKSIKAEGPMHIAAYMNACLFDPVDGFYPTRDPLGADGDFITSPEISQMFGEMIGLWCVQTWRDMGSPEEFNLIELGPGRGIMMMDMLRAANIDKGFLRAANIVFVEASPALQAVQGKTLSRSPCKVTWADSFSAIPKRHSIIIGNEFLDCLPIRQFVRKESGWHERLVAIDPDDDTQLIFALCPLPHSHDEIAHFPDGEIGDLAELCPGFAQIADEIKTRFRMYKGRALFIDYGPQNFEFGDTLQAIAAHKKVGALDSPGNADLTARVDFSHLLTLADIDKPPTPTPPLRSYGPQSQAAFLAAMGIEIRAKQLAATKPQAQDKLARQLQRLTHKDEMGQLFKAICLQSDSLIAPPGF